MSDPTAFVSKFNQVSVDPSRAEHVIKNAEALQINALAALETSTGKIEFADDASNLMPIGMVIASNPGNTGDALTGNSGGTNKGVTRGNIILENVSVTGVSAITDVGKKVYATDGQTLTLTRPTIGLPVGVVKNWRTSTYCDVHLFDFIQAWMNSVLTNSPSGYFRKSLGTFNSNALQGTSAITLYSEVSYEHYKIVSLHARCKGHDDAIVAGSQVLNLDIDGINLTGGALTIAYTDMDAAGDMANAVDATAITAANEVHIGNTLSLEMAASGTAFTADKVGAFEVYALCERLPGA